MSLAKGVARGWNASRRTSGESRDEMRCKGDTKRGQNADGRGEGGKERGELRKRERERDAEGVRGRK